MGEWVITLLADPARERLTEEAVQAVAAAAVDGRVEWRKAGEACDVIGAECRVQNADRDSPLSALCTLHSAFYDYILQPHPKPRRRLLICDMDSTMITVECIDELADFVGKKAQVAAITERAMNGELDFAAALTERVRLLAGLPEATLQRCYDERVRMMPGAKELLAHMRSQGAHCVLVSGGFTFFTARVAAELGFHEHYANTLEIKDGRLTGEVVHPILGKEAKLATLKECCRTLGISSQEVLAVGDGANDLPMLLEAGLGIAYHAKPVVQAQARARLNVCDLRALVYV